MKKFILAAAATAFLGLAYGASTSVAAPASPAQIAAPDGALTQVRMSDRRMMRHRMMHRKMMRHRMMRHKTMHRRAMRRRMMRSM